MTGKKMTEILIDINQVKPFNCKHYRPKTYLSISLSLGYCVLGEGWSIQFCKGSKCNDYEKR